MDKAVIDNMSVFSKKAESFCASFVKIRAEIESWHEQLGIESNKKNVTDEYATSSAGKAMLLHQVLSLFDVTEVDAKE